MDNEIFRTTLTTATTDIDVGEILNEFQALDSEAVATIQEIGIFGGSTATASADTGTLLSRVLWNKTKSNSEELIFRLTDKVVRG